MSAVSLVNKTSTASLLAGNVGFGTSYEWISSITVGSLGASSVSFTEIPQGYRHLQIRMVARDNVVDTGVSNIEVRFNGDTANNYVRHGLQGYSGASSAPTVSSFYGAASSSLAVGCVVDSQESASMFSPTIVDILDYSSAIKNKTTRSLFGFDNNGTYSLITLASGLWMSTAPIASIVLLTNPSGSFVQYSTFSLYGVR